jgi:hypothetical protein
MNILVAVGRVDRVERRTTNTGKIFYSFEFYIPSKQKDGKELEIKKFATMWTYDYDKRPDNLQDGSYVCLSATLEGYIRNTPDGRAYVNEKLKVIDLQMTCEPISKIGATIDDTEEEEKIPF